MKFSRRFTKVKGEPYHGINFEQRTSELRNSDGSKASKTIPVTYPRLEPGCSGHHGTKIFATCRHSRNWQRDRRATSIFIAWRDVGPTGANATATLIAKMMLQHFMTILVICWRAKCAHLIARNGLTLVFTMPTVFRGKAQGHHYVDPKPIKSCALKAPTNGRNRNACFIQSVQDDLVNENGIMDCGPVKHVCLNTAAVPGLIFRTSVDRGDHYPAAEYLQV